MLAHASKQALPAAAAPKYDPEPRLLRQQPRLLDMEEEFFVAPMRRRP